MSNTETRKTYRLTANKTKLYALAKRIHPNIEPMKNTDFIKYYRARDYALEFWSGEHFHHLFLSVCGGKARLADRWSTNDENDERTEHWECRAIELDVSPEMKYFVEVRAIEKGEDDESLEIGSF